LGDDRRGALQRDQFGGELTICLIQSDLTDIRVDILDVRAIQGAGHDMPKVGHAVITSFFEQRIYVVSLFDPAFFAGHRELFAPVIG
jgi:hypothetical protein